MLKYYINERRLHPKTALSCNLFLHIENFFGNIVDNPEDIILGVIIYSIVARKSYSELLFRKV
jgi:hypothetical protein